MGNLAFRRKTGNTLVTDMFDWSEYWLDAGPERYVETVNAVPYFLGANQRGRDKVLAELTLIFWDRFPSRCPLSKMDSLRLWAKANEFFVFTDHDGVSWDVKILNRLEQERDDTDPLGRKYLVNITCLRYVSGSPIA